MRAGVKIRDSPRVMERETTRIFFTFCRSPLLSASDTVLEMAIGSPNWVMVMTRSSVGKAIMKRPTPSAPMNRATTMRLTNPRTLVIKEASMRMTVPFRNFDIYFPAFSKLV